LKSAYLFVFVFVNFDLLQLLATDGSALNAMKDAASCGMQCDLQISKNNQLFERTRWLIINLISHTQFRVPVFASPMGG
jgi:hypothetical protein